MLINLVEWKAFKPVLFQIYVKPTVFRDFSCLLNFIQKTLTKLRKSFLISPDIQNLWPTLSNQTEYFMIQSRHLWSKPTAPTWNKLNGRTRVAVIWLNASRTFRFTLLNSVLFVIEVGKTQYRSIYSNKPNLF